MGLLNQIFGNADQTAAMGLLGANMMAGNTANGFAQAQGLLADAPRKQLQQQLAQMQVQTGQMTLDEQRRKLADDAAARQVLQGFYARQGMPSSAPAGLAAGGPGAPPDMGMPPSIQPSPASFQPGAQFPQQGASQQAAGGVTPKAEVWKQYNSLGDQLAAKGLVDKAQVYYGLAEKMRPKYNTTPQQMTDPKTGKLINVLVGEDGTITPVDYGVKPNMKLQSLGDRVLAIDENTAQNGQNWQMGQSPDSKASNAITLRGQNMTDARAREQHNIELQKADPLGTLGLNKNIPAGAAGQAGLSGDAFLATLQPGMAAQIKGIAEGKIQISPFTIRTPQGQAMLQMAMQYEPGTDQTTYQKRTATAKDAASGKLAQSNNALNTVAGHLAGLSDAADALNNTSVPVVNTAVNWLQSNMGDGRVKSFMLNANGVANELERAYRGSGGSEADIKQWRETLSAANSPEQFKQIFAKGAEMLQSKLEANQAQYEQGMAGRGGDYKAITPKTTAAFAKLRGQTEPAATGGWTYVGPVK